MADPKHLELVLAGEKAVAEWRSNNGQAELDLSGADLSGRSIEGVDLGKCNLQGADLRGSRLSGASFADADVRGSRFDGATVKQVQFAGARGRNASFEGATFDECRFDGFRGSESGSAGALPPPSFHRAKFTACTFPQAELAKSNFSHAAFENCQINTAVLTGADFRGAIVHGSSFAHSLLEGSDFTGVQFSGGVSLRNARVDGLRVDRYSLEMLRDFGDMTVGDRHRMSITDGLSELRQSFSGFWTLIHLSALVLFVGPYIWFLLANWTIAPLRIGPNSIWLSEALVRYMFGDGDWRQGFSVSASRVATFAVMMTYNLLRVILLWKTRSLLLKKQSTGLHPIFSLVDGWGRLWRFQRIAFYVYLAAVVVHLIPFLTQSIPVKY